MVSDDHKKEPARKITPADAHRLMDHHVAEAYRTNLKGEVLIRLRFNCGLIYSVRDNVDRDNPLDTIAE
jgi:hypothetical protein